MVQFEGKNISYEADYGWFKDGKKTMEINHLIFSINQVGYEDDNKGVLIIGDAESNIECVTKMPISEIKELISCLKSR